jgi:large subunit ribosomal protein LP0
VGEENVGYKKMKKIRMSMRGVDVVIMGKKNMMRKEIRGNIESNNELEKLINNVSGNVGFVFNSGDIVEVSDKMIEKKVRDNDSNGEIDN